MIIDVKVTVMIDMKKKKKTTTEMEGTHDFPMCFPMHKVRKKEK